MAVLVGVQVRGPEEKDYISTHSFYSTVNGEKMLHNKGLDNLCKAAMLSRFVSTVRHGSVKGGRGVRVPPKEWRCSQYNLYGAICLSAMEPDF